MPRGSFVSRSQLRVDPERTQELISAFDRRAHLVDSAPGFQRLEVWRGTEPGEITMVSWWSDRASFSSYMRSEEHRVSHSRIDPELQRGIKLEHLGGYELVAD